MASVLSSGEVLRPGCCSQAAFRQRLVQEVNDELGKRPRSPGGRSGKQLQEKEIIPLLSFNDLFICVAVGAGALAGSIALFSKMLCL